MTSTFSFQCGTCGETHEGSPSFGFDAPDPFLEQSEATRQSGVLGSDLCEYEDADGVHYFARVVLEIPIEGFVEPFSWTGWVLLSEESFEHYVNNYDEPVPDCMYFGLLCNSFPYYENTYGLAVDVHPRPNGGRPYLAIHQSDHELYQDFSQKISSEKARNIAEICRHGK